MGDIDVGKREGMVWIMWRRDKERERVGEGDGEGGWYMESGCWR